MGNATPHTAFDDPDTLRVWQRSRRRSTVATTLWVLSLPGFFVLETVAWESFVGGSLPAYLMVIPILVSVVGIAVSDVRRVQLKKMRGILAAYPWQDHPPTKDAHPGNIDYLKIPNPDDGGKSVSVVVRRYGLSGKRWRSALTSARTQGFRSAGDPRFAVVIAPQVSEGFLAARPTHALNPGKGARPDGVSEASWQHAQAAGISGESPFSEEKLRQLQTGGK